MTPSYFDSINRVEAALWEAADNLRTNSKLTAGEYCMPVLGVIFLCHASKRYYEALREIEADQASGKMPKRPLTSADFKQRRALMLSKEARYDELLKLPKGTDLGTALVDAMNAIERDFLPLKGLLPKEYPSFQSSVLEDLLRLFDRDEIRLAEGDVFGRINEYFLMKFAMQGAQDNGEFFTPPSLVQVLVNVIEPIKGVVFDPAAGSAGMFIQSSHFIEQHGGSAGHRVTFYGQEAKTSNLRLGKMNLAVHALEGNLIEANTFYQDEHNLIGGCDFVMANPPFNVDKVDADKVKNDPRLPFGLPGVNKDKNVSNGNYLWISYFWSYLKPTGRSGFVMSSQASSAGHGEMEVRRKLVETGDVDVMISIRSNFFYTRTVPCELWHFDKGKPKELKDKVLMIDARSIFRKVNRKIYDFSPEQLQNLTSIVWLYRGQSERFIALVQQYLERTLKEAASIESKAIAFCHTFNALVKAESPFLKSLPKASPLKEPLKERDEAAKACFEGLKGLSQQIAKEWSTPCKSELPAQKKLLSSLENLATNCRALVKEVDLASKLASRLIDSAERDEKAKEDDAWDSRAIGRLRKELEVFRQELVEQLKITSYFERQAYWLLSHFPEGKLVDVPGLVKLADRKEIEGADWSLNPGRYVGVAPPVVDEEFDFEQAITDIHSELDELNKDATSQAATIQKNLKEMGV